MVMMAVADDRTRFPAQCRRISELGGARGTIDHHLFARAIGYAGDRLRRPVCEFEDRLLTFTTHDDVGANFPERRCRRCRAVWANRNPNTAAVAKRIEKLAWN